MLSVVMAVERSLCATDTVGPVLIAQFKLLHLSLFSYIVNLIIASAQIAHRGGLLIEKVCEL